MLLLLKNKIHTLSLLYGKKWEIDLYYFVKNGFWIVIKQSMGTFFGLLLSITFSRLASKDIYGQYQLVLSIFSMISILSIPGLNIAVARSVAMGNDGEYKKSVRKSFCWSLLGSPVLFLIGLYYFCLKSDSILGTSLIISSVFFPFFYAPNTWGGFLMGKSKFDVYAKFSLILDMISTVFTATVVILFPNNLILIVSSYFISYSLINGLYYFKSLKYISNDKKDGKTLKYGWFLTLNYNIEAIAESINKVVIGLFLSPAFLAIYSIVSLLPVKFRNISKPFLNILFPKMTSQKVNLTEIIKKRKKFFYFLLLITFLLGMAYLFLIESVCLLLFGENYAEYYHYARYFSIFIILDFPILFMTKYIQAKKMSDAIFFTGPVFIIFKLALTAFFIFRWNLLGAIVAFNLCTVVKFLIFLIFLVNRKTNY